MSAATFRSARLLFEKAYGSDARIDAETLCAIFEKCRAADNLADSTVGEAANAFCCLRGCAEREQQQSFRLADFLEWIQTGCTCAMPGTGAHAADPSLGHPLRGVSVQHLQSEFLRDVSAAGFTQDAKVYDIEEKVIRLKGESLHCPRDGQLGAAYVDTLQGDECAGYSNVMLSYTWGYRIGDIVDSLVKFCQTRGLSLTRTYVWICCLCINQHKVRGASGAGQSVPFEIFRSEFGSRVRQIKHVVALMAPWNDPFYLTRVWCVYELYTADTEDVKTTIIMPPLEEERFRAGLCDKTSIENVWRNLNNVQVEHAKASVIADRNNIMALINDGPGIAKFNSSVVKQLTAWMVNCSETYLQSTWQSNEVSVDGTYFMLCQNVNKLLRNMGDFDRAADLMEQALAVADKVGQTQTEDQANLLRQLGIIRRKQGNFATAMMHFERSKAICDHIEALETSDGALLLLNIGIVQLSSNEIGKASSSLAWGKQVAGKAGVQDTNVGGLLCRWTGNLLRRQGRYQESAEELQQAMRIYEQTRSMIAPLGANLWKEIGELKQAQGDLIGALESYHQALEIQEKIGVSDNVEGRSITECIQDVEAQLGSVVS